MLSKNIETFLSCDKEWEEAGTVLFGAPFDSTTSYRPGSRFGSSAIRRESYGIESYSPYQDKDLEDIAVFDSGDIELPLGDAALSLGQIEERAATILEAGKRPFLLGGEHLVTLGAFRAAFARYPDIHVLHFDAHADLRDELPGGAALPRLRAAPLLGAVRGRENLPVRHPLGGPGGVPLGPRTTSVPTSSDLHGLEERLEQLGDTPVYFTLDLDVLDPSVFPGTGTPEPGRAVSFEELRKAVTLVCQRANVVACDVNELSPPYDQSGVSTMVACKIVREMLLALR